MACLESGDYRIAAERLQIQFERAVIGSDPESAQLVNGWVLDNLFSFIAFMLLGLEDSFPDGVVAWPSWHEFGHVWENKVWLSRAE